MRAVSALDQSMRDHAISYSFKTLHQDHGEHYTIDRSFTLDAWTGHYTDNFNDIFVGRRFGRKLWELSVREAGNQRVLHGRFRALDAALAAAENVSRTRHGCLAAPFIGVSEYELVKDGLSPEEARLITICAAIAKATGAA